MQFKIHKSKCQNNYGLRFYIYNLISWKVTNSYGLPAAALVGFQFGPEGLKSVSHRGENLGSK